MTFAGTELRHDYQGIFLNSINILSEGPFSNDYLKRACV